MIESLDGGVFCASAGAAWNSDSAPSSSARAGKKKRRARERPGRGSGLRGESVDVEGAGLRAPASRRAHLMPLGRWAAGPLGILPEPSARIKPGAVRTR